MTDDSEKDKERFLKNIEKDASGCWRWCAGRFSDGYAAFCLRGRTLLAHRASLLLFTEKKELTPGLVVCHSCRNKDCVNPEHLSEKTKEENNGSDRVRDGTDIGGERNPRSKLCWEAVRRIRQSQESRKTLAECYGVSKSAIVSVLRNKTWKE